MDIKGDEPGEQLCLLRSVSITNTTIIMFKSLIVLALTSSADVATAFSAPTLPFYAAREKVTAAPSVVEKPDVVVQDSKTTAFTPATASSFFAEVVLPPVPPLASHDLSIPYDAAARMAYASANCPGNDDFRAFQVRYETAMVEMVKAKARARKAAEGDWSVPYQAAAHLAFELAGRPGKLEEFETRYEMAMIEMVKAKRRAREATTDLTVPYHAAAMLAYKEAGSPGGDFEAFQSKYLEETVARIQNKAKNKVVAPPSSKSIQIVVPEKEEPRVIPGAAKSREEDLAKTRQLVCYPQDLELTIEAIVERF